MKTSIKKFEEAFKSGDKENIAASLNKAYKLIDKAVSKGTIHKNTAARKKSRLAKMLKTIEA